MFICLSLFLVALMAIIKCEFGDHGKHFIDMPFETNQHLISYCTEGKGIDRVKSLHSLFNKRKTAAVKQLYCVITDSISLAGCSSDGIPTKTLQ